MGGWNYQRAAREEMAGGMRQGQRGRHEASASRGGFVRLCDSSFVLPGGMGTPRPGAVRSNAGGGEEGCRVRSEIESGRWRCRRWANVMTLSASWSWDPIATRPGLCVDVSS